MALACVDERPSRRPNSQRFSRPVRFSSTEAYCPVTPTSWRIMCGSRRTSTPKMLASPSSIGSRVASIRSIVVLPAPLGPSTPNTSPRRTSRSMPSTARWAPKVLTRPVAETARSESGRLCHAQQRAGRCGFTPPSRRFQSIGWLTASRKWAYVGRRRPARVIAGVVAAAPQPRVERAGGPGDDGVGVGAGVGDDADVVVVVVRAAVGVGADEAADLHPDPVAGVGAVDADVVGEAGGTRPTAGTRRT